MEQEKQLFNSAFRTKEPGNIYNKDLQDNIGKYNNVWRGCWGTRRKDL